MTAYLSDLLAEMNGADLVACGILALLALWLALWALVTWAPVAWAWARSALARWHSRQVRRASLPQEFPPKDDAVAWVGPILVILPLVALVVAIMRCQGVGR